MPAYYNTVNATGSELVRHTKKARSQQEVILAFFRSNPHKRFTPFQIHAELFTLNTPITSVRRAITNLTNEGFLSKTTEQINERYNVKNHYWELRIDRAPVQRGLFA